ncbi:hypothetical protein OG339_48035 (plasmid) [Streptosporangium sp. NBC_01495]|uniref:hypothetical protein n=1 Tax=Streptosporangium sp. NBC_01495 TaxID=2903899 RepID=UPI002E3119EF|nr:hypothetical protein [Streptosporangium sp. NBC_01495]
MLKVANLGMGDDSSLMVLDLLSSPIGRKNLTVMIAQTGHEWPITKEFMEQVVFPQLRRHRIRTLQVARRGPRKRDGVVVLGDTDQPRICYTRPTRQRPYFTLGQEMLASGTIPQITGARKCSQKAKGVPLDEVRAERVTRGQRFLHLIGFEINEASRIAKDKNADTELRCGVYPLAEQGLDRAACVRGLATHTGGRTAGKSACTFCPFSLTNVEGRARTLTRFAQFPAEARLPLAMEEIAVRFNQAQGLAGVDRKSGRGIRLLNMMRQRPELASILHEHERTISTCTWSLYRVQRAVIGPAQAARRICAEQTGSRAQMEDALLGLGHAGYDMDEVDGIPRVWIHRRGEAPPTVEEFVVAAPHTLREKARPGFWPMWHAAR